MTYGVIGVGSIAASMVVGLCDGVAAPPAVLLSPRNAGASAELAARFPTARVSADNQAVVDGADTALLCLRPRDAEDVLDGLRFRADQAVVSAMAGSRSSVGRVWWRRCGTSRARSRCRPWRSAGPPPRSILRPGRRRSCSPGSGA